MFLFIFAAEKSSIMHIIGRNNEIAELNAIVRSEVAEFAVVYGRRRVGKTFLVNEFFENEFVFKVTGLAKKDKNLQLENFAQALTQYGRAPYPVRQLGLKRLLP